MSIVLSVNQKPCRVLATSLEDAQVHAAARMVARFGRLLGPEEEREIHDVRAFGPTVQFRYQREVEPPRPAEGFSRIETIRFERTRDASFTNRAVIVWLTVSLVAAAHRAHTMWRCLRSGERSSVHIKRMAGACCGCRGSRRSPRRCSQSNRWIPASCACRNGSLSRLTCSTVLMAVGLRSAGAGSRCRPRRRLHPEVPARPVVLHLRRSRSAGPGVRATARFSVP